MAKSKSKTSEMETSQGKSRRDFIVVASYAMGAVGAGAFAWPLIDQMNPAADTLALASIEVDISKIAEGQSITLKWRGKPVYVLRRTPEQVAGLATLNDDLKDPQSESSAQPDYIAGDGRALNEEYLVIVGLCTHLGCAPKFRPEVGAADMGGDEWLGGFFCPCHGSKFDLAGRVYKGVPASANLEIPPYTFENDNVLVIGVDAEVV